MVAKLWILIWRAGFAGLGYRGLEAEGLWD